MDRTPDASARAADGSRVLGQPESTDEAPILFDQYSRYASCAELVRSACPIGSSVLDVGSGSGRLLGRFLPGWSVTYVDPLLATSHSLDAMGCELESADLPEHSFDVVVAVDTLEHVPPLQRPAFVGRLSALARRAIVLSGPYADAGEARDVDEWVDELYRRKTGQPYPWLEEHHRYGLPELAGTRALLEQAGWKCRVSGNGHVPWMKELLPWVIALLDRPEHRRVIEDASAFFNRELQRFDHLPPVYRFLLFAWRGSEPKLLAEENDDERTRSLAREKWLEFQRHLCLLVSRHADALAAGTHGELAKVRETVLALEASLTRERDVRARLDRRLRRVAKEARVARGELETRLAVVEKALRRSKEEMAALDARHRALLATRSWRWTAPLRRAPAFLARVLRPLRKAGGGGLELVGKGFYHALPLGESARWRAKQVFFGLFGWVLGNSPSYASFRREKELRARTDVAAERTAAAPPPPAREGFPDVFVWGVIDWHFRFQRPQQIATQLARRGHRVFYVSSGFARSPEAGFEAERLDQELALYSVRLNVEPPPVIYKGPPRGATAAQLERSLRRLLAWAAPRGSWCVLDHPAWIELASQVPDHRLVYDCMDNHTGFAESGEVLADCEREAFARCETILVSSRWLEQHARDCGTEPVLVRNACQPEHFANPPADVFRDPRGREVIGYFGALAQWFDVELVRELARTFADRTILLVGADSARVLARLADLPNVQSTGEVPYDRLPHYLHGMDVCLIPFVRNELTLATNPVKVYEYLAAGKPVVTTDLPELAEPELDRLIRRRATTEDFIEAVREALRESSDDPVRDERRRFALRESWAARADTFAHAVAAAPDPLVGIVVVTWNNVALSRRCIDSVLRDSGWTNLDLVVVDNASSDATGSWLDELEGSDPRVRIVRNAENRGFAAACNQGLELARGDYLVVLNNDLVVTPGWIRTLVSHLRRDPAIGLIGPVTNNIGNEARVPTRYADMAGMREEARLIACSNAGKLFEIPALAFFCVLMPRSTWQAVGPLDENFGQGFFEDDDYCQRVMERGLRVVCAEDVFVHHELSAGFKQVDDERRRKLFERNKAYYESKWGVWIPHRHRAATAPERAVTGVKE